jgi:hypothetical protein
MPNGIKFEPNGFREVKRDDGSVFKNVDMERGYGIGVAETGSDWRERVRNQQAAERRSHGQWQPGDPVDLSVPPAPVWEEPVSGEEGEDDVEDEEVDEDNQGGYTSYRSGSGTRYIALPPKKPSAPLYFSVAFLLSLGVIGFVWSSENATWLPPAPPPSASDLLVPGLIAFLFFFGVAAFIYRGAMRRYRGVRASD